MAAIYNEAIEDGNATFDEGIVEPDHYLRFFEDPLCGVLCAIKESDVVGWATLEPRSMRRAYRFTGQIAVYVGRQFRGLGVGSVLMRELDHVARELHYHTLISENLGNNPASLALDVACGYDIVGTLKEAGFREGKWIDLIVTQKILSLLKRGNK